MERSEETKRGTNNMRHRGVVAGREDGRTDGFARQTEIENVDTWSQ